MSAIHKLLCMGIPAALMVGMAGCQYETVTDVLLDTLSEDRLAVEEHQTEWLIADTMPPLAAVGTGSSALQGSVWEITPALGSLVMEKKWENPDTVGWLHIPDTDISTAIVQNPEENNYFNLKNDYYLNRDFYGRPDKNGTFCADYRATFGGQGRKSLSRITPLYAHSWDDNQNGTLFSQLKRFRDVEFAREHPYVFFSTEAEDMAWEVFAVFDTTTSLPYVRPNLPTGKYQQVLDMVHELTYYNYDVSVGDDDKILVLSTCTYSVDGRPSLPAPNDYRFVVMAKLIPADTPRKSQAVFAVNDYRLQPDVTRNLAHL